MDLPMEPHLEGMDPQEGMGGDMVVGDMVGEGGGMDLPMELHQGGMDLQEEGMGEEEGMEEEEGGQGMMNY